jgi:hypothetical protein
MDYEKELNAAVPQKQGDISTLFEANQEQQQLREVREPVGQKHVDYAGYAGLTGLIIISIVGMLFWQAPAGAEGKLKSFCWAVWGASVATNLYAWGVA